MKYKTGEEIEALISLLDDPDLKVSTPVMNRLIEMGEPIVRILENKWEFATDTLRQSRIENIISRIQQDKSLKDIKDWSDCNGDQLLMGAYLIARSQYPGLSYYAIEEKIKSLKTQIWIELNDHLTAFEKIRVVNHFLFDVHNFSLSNRDMLSPQLYYIHHALDTRQGQPILLAIIYLEITERLELPVYGVNLPGHFLLCYQDRSYVDDPDGILFYINPASGGNILGKPAVKDFLSKQKIRYQPHQLKPVSKIETILELARGLHSAHLLGGSLNQAEYIDRILRIILERKKNQRL